MGSVEQELSDFIDPTKSADDDGCICRKSQNPESPQSLDLPQENEEESCPVDGEIKENGVEDVEYEYVEKSGFSWRCTDEDLSDEMKVKTNHILDVLNADQVNVRMLRELAVQNGGLMTDDIRRKVWPKLLNISVDDIVLQKDSSLYDHRDYNQVLMDVRRAEGRFPPGLTDGEREMLKKQLIDLIMRVLVRHPELHYYQGYHDICITILLAVGEEIAFIVVEKLSTNHLREFLDENMNNTRRMLNYLLPVVLRVDRNLGEFMERSEVGTIFALSWLITWYGHVLKDYKSIVRLYDFFLACHPLMPVYLADALVLHRCEEVLAADCEMTSVHSLLSKIPDNLQFEDLIKKAGEVFLICPPSTLAKQVRTQLRKQQLNLKNAKSRTLIKYRTSEEGKGFEENRVLLVTAIGITATLGLFVFMSNILSEYFH